MDQHVQDLINSLPPRPHRSRLGPYAELIDEMRKRGWTYRAIAKLLAESCGLRVSPSNIHYFVRTVRVKDQSTCKQQPILKEIVKVPADRMTATKSDVNARIAALKSRTPQRESPDKKFQFNPDEPLRLSKLVNAGTSSCRGKS